MNGLGLTVMGPWPQFTVTLAFTSALTSATAGTVRSNASWTERANEEEGVAARPALAASTMAQRTLDARTLIGSPDILALPPDAGRAVPSRRMLVVSESALGRVQEMTARRAPARRGREADCWEFAAGRRRGAARTGKVYKERVA